jgi:hypothetical protein
MDENGEFETFLPHFIQGPFIWSRHSRVLTYFLSASFFVAEPFHGHARQKPVEMSPALAGMRETGRYGSMKEGRG